MVTRITEPHPTISRIIADIHLGSHLTGITADDIAKAAKAKKVKIDNGRIWRYELSAIYFGVLEIKEPKS
jgi:hypothetical protein